jgi:predicted amidohydrolase
MLRGAGYPVFDLDFARVGVITCYDGYVSTGIYSYLDWLEPSLLDVLTSTQC